MKMLFYKKVGFLLTSFYTLVCLSVFGDFNAFGATQVKAAALDQIPGQVINIPIAGTDVPWLVSSYTDGGYVQIMAMENVCSVADVACSGGTGGQVWSASNNNKSPTYFTQMDNIYNNLPSMIGGTSRSIAVRNTTWDMDGFTSANPAVRSDNYNTPVASRVNLVSFYEWQKGKDDGSSAPGMAYTAEPAANSMGDLFCSARFRSNCLGSNLYDIYDYPWTRSAGAVHSAGGWRLYGNSSDSLDDRSGASDARGLLPVLWLSSSIETGAGEGTYAAPYTLVAAPPTPSINLVITSATHLLGKLEVKGVATGVAGQTINIRSAACNIAGKCVLKTATVTENNPATGKAFTLTWADSELPSGNYSGTIWVDAVSNGIFSSAESGAVNFAIAGRQMDLTVVRGRVFELVLGDADLFNLTSLTPGTNGGVTVSVDGVTNKLIVSGTLNGDMAILFGSAILNFTTLAVPQSNFVEVDLN